MVIMSIVVLLTWGNREAQRIKVVDIVHKDGGSLQGPAAFLSPPPLLLQHKPIFSSIASRDILSSNFNEDS